MNATFNAGSPGDRNSLSVTGNVAGRLDAAMWLALRSAIFPSPYGDWNQTKAARAAEFVFAAVCSEERADLASADLSDFHRLTHPVVETPGGHALNLIWVNPSFILPAIPALAQFFDRCLDPSGDSAFTLTVESDPSSLTGYRLIDISTVATRQDGLVAPLAPRTMTEAEWLRVSTLLVSSAMLVLASELAVPFLSLALDYLHSEARRSASGAAPMLDPVSGNYRLDGASGFIRVLPRGTTLPVD